MLSENFIRGLQIIPTRDICGYDIKNKIGTIINAHIYSDKVIINFEDVILGGHSCNGMCGNNNGLILSYKYLEPIVKEI